MRHGRYFGEGMPDWPAHEDQVPSFAGWLRGKAPPCVGGVLPPTLFFFSSPYCWCLLPPSIRCSSARDAATGNDPYTSPNLGVRYIRAWTQSRMDISAEENPFHRRLQVTKDSRNFFRGQCLGEWTITLLLSHFPCHNLHPSLASVPCAGSFYYQ